GLGTGPFALSWAPVADAPANDNLASAQTLPASSGSLTGSNVLASREGGEPLPPSAHGRSVWYRWTPPSSGRLELDTQGSYFPTQLSIFTGSAVDALTLVGSNAGYWGDNAS